PSPSRSSSTSGAGSHDNRQAHWNNAPARVRRCEMPTTLVPPIETSPGPSPAKQTLSDQRLRTSPPRCTDSPLSPSEPSAADQASPNQRKARPTSASHNGSPAGTNTSAHTVESAARNTAPPPLRRRTTSIPNAAARS